MRPRARAAAALTAALVAGLAIAGCTPSGSDGQQNRTPNVATASATPAANRPVVTLAYDVADDLRSVTGSETIVLTPDQQVCEVVLRSWPNKPVLTKAGNGMTVGGVRVDGKPLQADVQAAGASAGAAGTLVEAKLPACSPAGSSLKIEADFAVTLGADTDERMGYSTAGELAWFQTAFPLLAWQNGVGWVRDAAVDMYGETATSEAFALKDLSVSAPARYEVAGVGARGAEDTGGDRTIHHFSAPVMRDVAVMVGDFDLSEHTASGTDVHLAVPRFARLNDVAAWQQRVDASLAGLVDYLGAVPFSDVWVNVVPGGTEGIESSGEVQLGGNGRRVETWLVTHELAHQWTYALVGNNQAQHPWLDEAVTSMIQAVVDDPRHSPEPSDDYSDSAAGDIGRPMSFFATSRHPDDAYNESVYGAGADVLIEARDAAGHDAFDAALRNYLAANAYRVAAPADFAAAFAGLPAVTSALKKYGLAS